MMMQIIFAIAIALFAHDETTIDYSFNYIQIGDVRDETNNYQNMRETIELCYRINATQQSIDQCAQRAYDIAISIDA
jgi:hypothetical protein